MQLEQVNLSIVRLLIKKQNKNKTGHWGSGGQLHCRLMLLTEDLFIQGNGCPSFFPRPWGKEMHSMMLCRGGGTTSITAKTRPLVQRQREAELTPSGRLPLCTGEAAISIRVRPDLCYKRKWLIEGFIIWHNNNHLGLNINKRNELMVDYKRYRYWCWGSDFRRCSD